MAARVMCRVSVPQPLPPLLLLFPQLQLPLLLLFLVLWCPLHSGSPQPQPAVVRVRVMRRVGTGKATCVVQWS